MMCVLSNCSNKDFPSIVKLNITPAANHEKSEEQVELNERGIQFTEYHKFKFPAIQYQ